MVNLSSRNFNKLKFRQPFDPLVKGAGPDRKKRKRRPSPLKRGCPKGDRRGAKRVPIWFSNSSGETKKLGETLGKEILKIKEVKKAPKDRAHKALCARPTGQALILGLEGDLGGGKTTFLQGFAKGLGIKEKILSPTFIILRKFKVKSLKFKVFYHIDCYRISGPKDILLLGFKEIISNPKNIVAIEWADRIRKILPKDALILKFEFTPLENSRMIELTKITIL